MIASILAQTGPCADLYGGAKCLYDVTSIGLGMGCFLVVFLFVFVIVLVAHH